MVKGLNFAITSFPGRLNIFWGLLAIYFIANCLCIFLALYTGVREFLFFPGFSFLLYHFPYNLFHLQLWEKRSGIILQHVEEGESELYFKHLASLLAENTGTCSFTLPSPPLTHTGVSAPFQGHHFTQNCSKLQPLPLPWILYPHSLFILVFCFFFKLHPFKQRITIFKTSLLFAI